MVMVLPFSFFVLLSFLPACPSLLPSFLPSVLLHFLLSFLSSIPSFLPSFYILPSFLPSMSFLPSFDILNPSISCLSSFLPSFLPSFDDILSFLPSTYFLRTSVHHSHPQSPTGKGLFWGRGGFLQTSRQATSMLRRMLG